MTIKYYLLALLSCLILDNQLIAQKKHTLTYVLNTLKIELVQPGTVSTLYRLFCCDHAANLRFQPICKHY